MQILNRKLFAFRVEHETRWAGDKTLDVHAFFEFLPLGWQCGAIPIFQ